MDKSVLMLLFLGCFPLVIFQVYALQCRLCNDYFNGQCTTDYTTCNTSAREFCRHFRVSNASNMSYISIGHSDCTENCSPFYIRHLDSAYIEYCCIDRDLCNDDTVPVDKYVKNLAQINLN
ncbi:prostate and testis expressed protein 14-like [Ochotona princeps]|uniref:prostate and testis expressed protein 14-like n=1 Tax=Ochotona princeps TaxID=9978 RepID=UPI002714EFE3|nr:prostate and testis expressed protein 14-like [Ochotona princeps]